MAKERGKRRQKVDFDMELLKEMVTTAFQESSVNKLTTEDIYKVVFKNFPNIGNHKTPKLQKLKTSVRTVLSRYECFSKMERAMKGNYWKFNEDVSGDAKRKPVSRLSKLGSTSASTKTNETEDQPMDTAPVARRESRRRRIVKPSPTTAETTTPPKTRAKRGKKKVKAVSKEPADKEKDGEEDKEVEHSVTNGQEESTPKEPIPDEPKDKPSPIVDEKTDTASPDEPSKTVENNIEEKPPEKEPEKSEDRVNGVTSPEAKSTPDQVNQARQDSPSVFPQTSPSNTPFAHLPPTNNHFGQPSPSSHSIGSPSPHSSSFGQPSPSFGPPQPPPPNYHQFGGYCSPNGQFGLPSSQLGYSTSHFGYSSVPIGMPTSHFGYSSVPSNQFYPSPSPFLPPFHYPAGHPYSPNRF